MSGKLLNAIAVLLMLLALGSVAGAISASSQRVEIQGPSALAVLPDRSVWLSVDDAMWHLDENGKRVAVVDAATLGVGGRIGNLVVHPAGQLVAQVRNDPTLYFLDPATAVIKSRLVPQWQSDLKPHGSDAINYAFSDDGRVAIATGGGHAVALFDANGRFLGRTQPGMYEFTNGLLWAADSLWTTDTNRQQLVELDGNTLTEKSRVALAGHTGNWQFLGMATPSHGKASEKSHMPPLVTLIRFANGMTKGHATDVFGDGSQLDYPVSNIPEPRDIKWRDNELLMVDNASFSIKRYSDNRAPMADFGDAQVQADLAAALDRRQSLERKYNVYLFGAILLFIVGFALALRAQAQAKTKTLAALNVDLSQLGTPILPASARSVAAIRIFWPMILAVCALAVSSLFVGKSSALARTSPEISLLIFLSLQLLFVLFVILLRWNIRRRRHDPMTEAVFNYRAVQFLQTDATFWKLHQPDELPQETLILANAGGRVNWLVLTNKRLLVFVMASLRDRVLIREYLRSDIVRMHCLEPEEMSWRQKLQCLLIPVVAAIRLEFKDKTSLDGFASAQTARRMTTLLQPATSAPPSIDDMYQMQLAAAQPRAMAKQGNGMTRHAVASLVIPGLGQWMQHRSGTAFYFFIAWLFALSSVIPVAWTLWHALAAVSWQMILFSAGAYMFICMLASLDAWAMRERVQQ